MKIAMILFTLVGLAEVRAWADPQNGSDFKLELAPPGVLDSNWKPLLDAKMTNWEVWIGVPYKEVLDASGKTVLDAAGKPEVEDWTTGKPIDGKWPDSGTPMGLNNDHKHVFTMIVEDGEPVLHITGEIFGGFTTLNSYSNYHFRCQFKWGNLIWAPKLKARKDNGILFDCTGPHGAFGHVWKRCLEFQVEDKGMGNLYCLAGTGADVVVTHDPTKPKPTDGLTYDPTGNLMTVRGKVSHLKGDFESPMGEWNTLELYSIGQTAVEVVNGKVVQVLRNTVAYPPGNKPPVPLASGQIQLQSEGAEAEYRRVEIQGITAFPPDIIKDAALDTTPLPFPSPTPMPNPTPTAK